MLTGTMPARLTSPAYEDILSHALSYSGDPNHLNHGKANR
jgi:hypothetical protein